MDTAIDAAPGLALESRLFGRPAGSSVDTPTIIAAMLDSGKGISDLIFSPGRPPQVERHGELVEVPLAGVGVLSPEDTARIARDLFGGNAQRARRSRCQTKTDLPPAGHFDIQMREQFGIEKRAMLDSVAAIDAITGAERIQTVFRAGMKLARHLYRATHSRHIERRTPGARKLGDIVHERVEPVRFDAAGAFVRQQRRTDFHDDAPRLRPFRARGSDRSGGLRSADHDNPGLKVEPDARGTGASRAYL